jgi:hypothetical protein
VTAPPAQGDAKYDAVIIDSEEERAVRLLAEAGLVPGLRHQRASG